MKILSAEANSVTGAPALASSEFAWKEIVGPVLQGFDYEHEGVAIRWHVAGPSSPIIIDPRLSFGTPTIKGVT